MDDDAVQVKPLGLRAAVWFVPVLLWTALLVLSVFGVTGVFHPGAEFRLVWLAVLSVVVGLALVYRAKVPQAWKLSPLAMVGVVLGGGALLAIVVVVVLPAAFPALG